MSLLSFYFGCILAGLLANPRYHGVPFERLASEAVELAETALERVGGKEKR